MRGQKFVGLQPLMESQLLIAPMQYYPAVLAQDIATKITEKQDEIQMERKQSISRYETLKEQKYQIEKETRSYSLIYYNPESKKSEVLEGSTTIEIDNYTSLVVEESLSQRSTYSIFSFIATPFLLQYVDERLLNEILSKIDVEPASKFGGGVAIKTIEDKLPVESLVRAMNASDEEKMKMRDCIVAAVEKKKIIEREVDSKVVVFEEVVNAIRKGDAASKAIARLPTLSKVRFEALLRKKRLTKKIILSMLEKDKDFLKAVSNRLASLTLKELLELAKTVKILKEKMD